LNIWLWLVVEQAAEQQMALVKAAAALVVIALQLVTL
jgi:hypothetical protein